MILPDTHVWVWWINEPTKLPSNTLAYLDNLFPTSIHISLISCCEVAKLVQKSKLILPVALAGWFELAIDKTKISLINLEREMIIAACSLPELFHADPANQLIVATFRIKNIPLLTADGKILSYKHVNARQPWSTPPSLVRLSGRSDTL